MREERWCERLSSSVSSVSGISFFFRLNSPQFRPTMVPRVVLTRSIPSQILDRYASKGQIELIRWEKDSPADSSWLSTQIETADAVVCMLQDSISEDLLSKASSSLKVISTMSVGFDHVDLNALRARGIRLGYTPFVLDQAVAELTLTLALNLSRQVPRASRIVRNGEWGQNGWSPLSFCGPSLEGKTIGFLGFGNSKSLVMDVPSHSMTQKTDQC